MFEQLMKVAQAKKTEVITKESSLKVDTVISRTKDVEQGQPAFQRIALDKNFHKADNDIIKIAVRGGLFKSGKSKEIYDVLYYLTRGAIKPTRTVRISKPKLRELTGVKTRATLDAGIAHLVIVKLLKVTETTGGQHLGHEYEIFTAQEVQNPAQQGQQAEQGQQAQKITMLSNLESNHAQQGLISTNIEAVELPKTLINTLREKTDDETAATAFADLERVFDNLFKELTGKGVEVKSRSKLKDLAEVLAQEIRVAASRTETISDVAAFAARHFSNRFFAARRKEEVNIQTNVTKTNSAKRSTKERPPHIELCPDCFGSGYYNPDGKGVRPGCSHTRLAEKVSEMKAAGELSD
jgi:hypothetical protein